jgi:hypothetical protein
MIFGLFNEYTCSGNYFKEITSILTSVIGMVGQGGKGGVQHGGLGLLHFASSTERFLNQYNVAMLVLFASCTVFSVTDFLTSSIAVYSGLSEANFVLTTTASLLGLSLPAAFAITKIQIIMGTALVGAIGIRSRDNRVRMIAMGVVSTFCILFLYATLNNVYWISTLH